MDILPVFTPCASKGDLYLSDYSPSDVKWDKHRGNTEAIGAIYATNPAYARFSFRMAACSTLLGFSRGIDSGTGEVKIKLQEAKFCKVRNCPTCAWRRSMRNTARFFSKLPELQARFPSHRWLFLTLTIPNCYPDQLREYLGRMNKAWQRLIQRKDWPASGWVRATEVTRGDDGSAHPHFHVLLMVPASYFGKLYVTQDEWLNRWREAMRDSSITQVDIRAVKPSREGQTIQAAIVETLKYATKVEDGLNHPDWLFVITAQLHKLRFLASGGELKGILKEDISDKEMISGDDQETTETPPEADLFFGWKSEVKRYVKKGGK